MADSLEDKVLKRMLKTPPKPHAPLKAKRPGEAKPSRAKKPSKADGAS